MPHLLNIWPVVSRQLASSRRILLIFDYDGTLTPIVGCPQNARLSDNARRCLVDLAEKERFIIGVVSGRELTELEELVAIPGLIYAGNDGLEIRGLGMNFVHPQTAGLIESVTKVAGLLEQELEYVPKLLVHNKRLTVSVHFKNTPDKYLAKVNRTVASVLGPYVSSGEIKVTHGIKIIQADPNIDWGKGEAIREIHRSCGDNPFLMFFGDDRDDEDGFDVVQDSNGIAVCIGHPRQHTKALHKLESPAEVAQVLELLGEFNF